MMRNLLACIMLMIAGTVLAQEGKLPYSFLQKNKTRNSNDSVTLSLAVKNNFQKHKIRILKSYANILLTKLAVKDLDELLKDSTVIFINEQIIPKEELTTGATDFTLNKINRAHNTFPQFNGNSLNASVKERLFDTSDIDLKGRVFKTGLENTFITAHASLMATTIAGAGNSSSFALGTAWKSMVSSSSFLNLLPDADSVMQLHSISLQNHSYGTAIENFYGNEAFGYDRQMNNLPTLLHVFSSGNSGNITNTAGPYSGVQASANLTGNFKQAKNIITVGSVDSAGQLMPLSSKGPAYDGRIKPELTAYGEDGSSGAAALVSGAALLIQDAWKRNHAGLLPSSSLVKAILLNSADDVGNPGPDYASGYGSLNAFKAIITVTENRFIENSVTPGQIKSFALSVPSGISKLKITLCWNDPAASPNASKALVNDLDMLLKLPSTGENWLPWALSSKENSDSLQAPAQRKTDTLNNVEQITIDNPVAGNYSIEIKASTITTASQNFSIAYQFDTASVFYWTYPTSTDPLLAGNTHWLRWETTIAGTAQIEYATNGNNWRTAGMVTDLSKKYFKWTLPDTTTTAVLRMKISSGGIIVSDTFTINPPLTMQVGFNCTDSFLVYWNALQVNNYRLYEAGSQYLQPFDETPDTSVILSRQQHQSLYYAVAPLINGKEGFRSATINYKAQGVECYLQSFFLQMQNGRTALFAAELGSLYHVAEVSLEKFNGIGYSAIARIANPATTSFSFSDTALRQGVNVYRISIRLQNGTTIYSNVETVYYTEPGHPVVLYPNPVRQNTMLNIITNESGRYILQMIDDNGRMVLQQQLNSTLTTINSGFFAKGLYVIRIVDSKGKSSSQKLVIY